MRQRSRRSRYHERTNKPKGDYIKGSSKYRLKIQRFFNLLLFKNTLFYRGVYLLPCFDEFNQNHQLLNLKNGENEILMV